MTGSDRVTGAEPEAAVQDLADPAHWAQPEFRIQAPEPSGSASKLSCLRCKDGTAHSDGAGGYMCFRCGWNSAVDRY